MACANDTIAAIATASGRGAVGVVRVSGADVPRLAQLLLGKIPTPRLATYAKVSDPSDGLVDRAIAIYYPAPKSFTGEHVLEIQTHGGPIVTRDVLQLVVASGARQAGPGEFTERAYHNGKIDLVQAEAIADLIESTSSRAARLAQQSLSGEFSREINALNRELIAVRVQIEALLDFPDEDIDTALYLTLAERSADVARHLGDIIVGARRGARLNDGLDIAIVGEPNVGKSTLLNRLAATDHAIVDPLPGTTRDILSVDVQIAGLTVRFHDTAGIRDGANRVEQEGIRRAKALLERVDAVFYCFTGPDIAAPMIDALNVPVFRIRNKIDRDDLPAAKCSTGSGAALQISAKFGDGLELLTEALLETFDLQVENDSIVLARARHIDALEQARRALEFSFLECFRDTPELGAENLRLASLALSQITGEFSNEDLLGEIFSTFCIGK